MVEEEDDEVRDWMMLVEDEDEESEDEVGLGGPEIGSEEG